MLRPLGNTYTHNSVHSQIRRAWASETKELEKILNCHQDIFFELYPMPLGSYPKLPSHHCVESNLIRLLLSFLATHSWLLTLWATDSPTHCVGISLCLVTPCTPSNNIARQTHTETLTILLIIIDISTILLTWLHQTVGQFTNSLCYSSNSLRCPIAMVIVRKFILFGTPCISFK